MWSDSFPLDCKGAGWRYNPQVKFLSIVGLPLVELRKQVVTALSQGVDASELILSVEEFVLYVGPNGRVVKSPTNSREVLRFRP